MPIHLPALTRRQFLGTTGIGVLAWSSLAWGKDVAVVEDVVYLLNDTHIGENQAEDSPVCLHLQQVVQELVALERKPAGVLINGDLALKDGQLGDYRHFAKLIAPLREAKLDLHLTLGNHDNRDAFYEVMKEERPERPPVESRHISVVETKFANFFLLDSLQKTMLTPGAIGEEQLAWLAKALDAHSTKPAIIVAHHNPRLGGYPVHYPGGLVDSNELWETLAARKHVKAYIHGHIHDRTYAVHQGIHIINTPATSYVGNPQVSTTGWTVARLTADGITLKTATTDENHAWNGEVKTLTWRES